MRSFLPIVVLLPLVSAQLNDFAQEAGLLYFGTATDTPGQRERAGFQTAYAQYDSILNDIDEFGQLTPSNGMKWLFTEPEQGVFNWTEGEVVSQLAKTNGQYLRCHNLVWHSQLPDWVTNGTWTADTMRAMLTKHVWTVADHWKGQCYAWDVVNEALNDDGTYRQSIFYQTLGEEYIKLAFKTAAEADPDAKLYYNDYNLERTSNKTQAARNIVKMLQAENITIDGIGMQAHLHANLQAPTYDDIVTVMQSYEDLGVECALTELDVRIELPVNDTNLAWQAEVYANASAACGVVQACVGITMWDFYDPFSWVPATFPGQGAPLLWFDDFSKHPAYNSTIIALDEAAAEEYCSENSDDTSCSDE